MPLTYPILIPISFGELIDKITILRIKASKLLNPTALSNVRDELEALEEVFKRAATASSSTTSDSLKIKTEELQKINQQLWDVEDQLRLMESKRNFDDSFITAARSVYQLNDQRAGIKKSINMLCQSPFMEEKSYGERVS